MKIKRETLEKLVSLLEIASKDETRFYLNGVHIKRISPNEVCLEATDGYILTQFFTDDFENLDNMIIESQSIKELKSFLKSNKEIMLFDWSNEQNYVKITSKLSFISLKKIHRDYPNTSCNNASKKTQIKENYMSEIDFNLCPYCEKEPWNEQYDYYGIYCGKMCDTCFKKKYKQYDYADECSEQIEKEE